jgi:uroporphyrinogen-III synthase
MQAVYYPTLSFLPPENDNLLIEQISNLNQYEWLIFLSPQAVMQSLHKYFHAFQGKVAAIGLGTVKALQNANIPVDCYPNKNWNSEGLLTLSPFQNCQNVKIALIKGEGGRQLLAKELTSRGALITEINCYRRVKPSTSLLDPDIIDFILITSIESLQNLMKMTTDWQRALNKTLIVISERIQIFAKESGFKKIVLVENASDEAILTTLRKIS